MQIIQLEKTFETCAAHFEDEDVYFLRLTKFKNKSGSQNHQVSSKPISKLRVCDLSKYIDDPDIVLVKFAK